MQTLTSILWRLHYTFLALGLVTLAGSDAQAALKKYETANRQLAQYNTTSPKTQIIENSSIGVNLIDDSGVNPILRKWVNGTAGSKFTVIVPELSGFIFLSEFNQSGPAPDHTGTGSTASSIDWGRVDGFTVTGGAFCHAIPSYICTLAGRVDLATVGPPIASTQFDIGTWVFHGTGFTNPGGYIARTASGDSTGNTMLFRQGTLRQDGTVPAIPLLGIAAVGSMVVGLSVATYRRRRD